MDQPLVCAECQQKVSPRGRILATAQRAAALQNETARAMWPEHDLIEFAAHDDFERNALSVTLYVCRTRGANAFGVATSLPMRQLVNADVSARVGEAFALLVDQVYKHPHAEGERLVEVAPEMTHA